MREKPATTTNPIDMVDAVVIGAGPNGLVAANVLAEAGWSVLVLEAQPEPGGAVRSMQLTREGFVHDFGAGFFPFGPHGPPFRAMKLEDEGLTFCHAELDSCHPALDGSEASISRDFDAADACLGPDADAWRRIATWHRETRDAMLKVALGPLPPHPRDLLSFGIGSGLRLGSLIPQSGRGISERLFETEAARRIIPGLALHTDVGPDDPAGAIVGFVLAIMATSGGFGVPKGGAQAITDALVAKLERGGGEVRTSTRVARIVVEGRRAIAVETEAGDAVRVSRAILADTAAPTLFCKMLPPQAVPTPLLEKMRSYPLGFGTFKVDFALSGPVPWSSDQARRAAVVHLAESNDDMARFVREVRAGQLPTLPYLLVGQQSLLDPTRAPQGAATLYAYSRVPRTLPGGWAAAREAFADRVVDRIEGMAPGFRETILDRFILCPERLEARDENLLGGDLGGGTAAIDNQMFFRPAFPYFRYRMPIDGLFLASSYAHPGAGVHGACGFNAAREALRVWG